MSMCNSCLLFSGLKVVGSICDATSINGSAINKLIEPDCTRAIPLGSLLEYDINGMKIIHIFDPPHLIKSIRNNLLVKNLIHHIGIDEEDYISTGKISWDAKCVEERSASWSDVASFYEFDCSNTDTRVPKLTWEHINPEKNKMKVKLATQVFSGSLGREMYLCANKDELPKSCFGTSIALLFFDVLFDSLNGNHDINSDDLKGAVHANSSHYAFWEYAIRMLRKMKFSPNLETGRANRSNVLKHFISTLKGIRKICKNLQALGFSSVVLRQFNQDALENCFGSIRNYCGCNTKPTVSLFKSAYSTYIINNMTYKSIKANCEDDGCKPFLHNVDTLFSLVVNDDTTSSNYETQSKRNTRANLTGFDCDALNPQEAISSAVTIQTRSHALIRRKLLDKFKCSNCDVTMNNGKAYEEWYSDGYPQIRLKLDFDTSVGQLLSKTQNLVPLLCAEKNIKAKIISGKCLLHITFNRLRSGKNIPRKSLIFKELIIRGANAFF